uniref:Variant surface glycoprotein n=1 Tax=Trypanosoma brucei brucei TaxID=5702 RepID=B3GVM7_TRYBB|nr:variant surface glycoprotein [Trypanosoma brucei brucei]
MAMKTLLNLTLVLVILKSQVPGALAAAGDNEHLFLDLCHLMALTKRALPEVSEITEAEVQYAQIQKLNSSLSSLEWRKQFEKPTAGESRPSYGPKSGPVDEIRRRRWRHWTKAEEELDSEEPKGKTLAEAGASIADPTTALRWREALHPIAEKAALIMERLESANATYADLKKEKISALIAESIYGKTGKTLGGITSQTFKDDNGQATTRQTLCGDDTANPKAHTVTAYMFCLCAGHKTDSVGADKVCTSTQAAHNQANSGDLNGAETAVKDLVGKCYTDAGNRVLSPEEIRLAVSTFTGKLVPAAGKAYYGKYAQTGCDGSNANGICVMYTTATAADAAAAKNIPWARHLLEAAHKLAQQADANRIIEAMTAELKTLKLEAYSVGQQIKLRQEIHKLTTSTEAASAKTEQQDHQVKEQCEAIKKATDCEKKQPKCEWKNKETSEGPHCKLNATYVPQQATQTGGTTTAASTGCASHKNQPDCEKDKTGDRKNCAWRKGNDGETDEPDKEKCRNGSFLATKKFALSVVSAAFVALLF